MEKICINCNRKIEYMATAYKMPFTGEIFCSACKEIPLEIISKIRSSETETKEELLEKAKKDIAESKLTMKARDALTLEAEQRINSFSNNYENPVWQSELDIPIEAALARINEIEPLLGSTVERVGDESLEVEDVKIRVIVFEQYFFRTGSYASLSITLVGKGEKTNIVMVASGGGEGLLNISYGAENSFANKFKNLFINGPQPEVSTYEKVSKAIKGVLPKRKNKDDIWD